MDLLSVAGIIVPLVQIVLSTAAILSSVPRTHGIDSDSHKPSAKRSHVQHLVALVAMFSAEASAFTAHNYETSLTVRLHEFCDRIQNAGQREGSSESIAAATRAAAISCVSRYSESAETIEKVCKCTFKKTSAYRPQLRFQLDELPRFLPSAMRSPPPMVFFASCIIYSSSIVVFYQIHRESDKYQPHALITGLLLAVALGFMNTQTLQSVILSILPTTALICLALSSWLHSFARQASRWHLERSVEGRKHSSDSCAERREAYVGEHWVPGVSYC